jgi:hypothetical protein
LCTVKPYANSPKTSLENLETFAPTEDEVIERYTNIIVDDLGVAFWGVVVTQYMHRSHNLHARCIRRNDHDRLLSISVRVVGIRLSDDQMDGTSRVSGTGYPPIPVASS